MLADFEDDSIASAVGDVKNAAATDCAARAALIPARGQRCLTVEVGATAADAYAACDLTFRVVTPFAQADKIAAFCWIKKGTAAVAFRVRDARGQVFETIAQPIREFDRWVRIEADLTQEHVRRIAAVSPPRGAALPASQPSSPWDPFGDYAIQWPIELRGFRVAAPKMGQQIIFIDDIQVEHRVEPADTIHGEFEFDKPSKIYSPGTTVAAKVAFENRSRTRPLRLAVELAWRRPDGTVLKTQQGNVQLPASGVDFRARQAIDFSLKIDEPGLYSLVARARAAAWKQPNIIETTIAVQPSNRNLSRGRSTFFGVRTNLLREPRVDQLLEIEAVKEIGAHLLALDTPWRLIEPKRDAFDFTPLDSLVDAVATRGVALMLVISEPPDWIAADPSALPGRQAFLIEALAGHFAEKVQYYQVLASAADESPSAGIAALAELQRRISKLRPAVRMVSAPTRIATDRQIAPLAETAAVEPAEWAYESSGAIDTARRAFAALGGVPDGDGHATQWAANHRWFHVAAPLIGAGHLADAEDVLSFCVDAAAAGVPGIVWYDLRDDDNDPASPALQNGLLQRDFSPKATLWGFASAVGMLTGLRHAGSVHGTPAEFRSALFVASDQQVALVQPLPNRIRPAVLAPIRGVAGTFSAQDFERRSLRLLESGAPPLLIALAGPTAVTLKLETAQPEPQIGFSKSWLRFPGLVFADPERPFTIELDPPLKLQRSYLQIALPEDARFESSVSARALKGVPGETLATEVTLTPKSGAAFERSTLIVKLSLEGKAIEVPVEVRPALSIGRLAAGAQPTDDAQRVGKLAARAAERPNARAEVFAGWTSAALLLRVAVDVDAVAATGGERVLLGIALENADPIYEVALREGPHGAVIERAFADCGPAPEGWQVQTEAARPGGRRTWDVSIPAAAFGVASLTPEQHALLAVRYVGVEGGRTSPTELSWGSGLDGSRSSAGYVWVRLRD